MAEKGSTLRKHVLVAEDNPSTALIMRFHLEHAGLDVTVARSGIEAWDWLQRAHFDLVITDEQMPGMSGLELCRQIQACPLLRHLPVIMVTAKSYEIEQDAGADQWGVRQMLSKTFSPQELVAKVGECLELTGACP